MDDTSIGAFVLQEKNNVATGEDLLTVINYNHLFTVNGDEYVESTRQPYLASSSISYYDFLASDMHFVKLTGDVPDQKRHLFKSVKPYISLFFSFNSSAKLINKHSGKVFADIKNNQAGIIFINNDVFESCINIESGGELYIINVTTQYFERFLSPENPLNETFHLSKKENLPVLLNENVIDMNARIKALLYDLFSSEHKNYYKYLYLRSRFIELLMLLFQEYETVYKKLPEILTSDSNLEKMYEVKDIIDSNITQSCSLLDLAQQVGTNECYLKRHFKQVFGTTVFGYVHTQRMQHSKELLMNEDMKIAEVAKKAGYKHASHFTTAFKKYFGYLPHQIKLILLSLINWSELAYGTELAVMAL